MGCFYKLRHKKRANKQVYNDAALKSNITTGVKDVNKLVKNPNPSADIPVAEQGRVTKSGVVVVAGVWDITEGTGVEVAEVEGAVVEAEDAVEVEAVEVHGLNRHMIEFDVVYLVFSISLSTSSKLKFLMLYYDSMNLL
ncbi:hypothetical protein QYF36_002502 [Acer negundo]|nr:hypothetical protein QYF36_002502 [Acer negundo]